MKPLAVFLLGFAIGWLLTRRRAQAEPQQLTANEESVLYLVFGDGLGRAPTWDAWS